MDEVQEHRQDCDLCSPCSSKAAAIPQGSQKLGTKETMKEQYGMRLDNLMNGIRTVGEDLEFLCSLIEYPVEEYQIPDAVEYSNAVVALMNQLTYMTSEINLENLTDDGELVILTKKQVETLSLLSDNADEAVEDLRECGISIISN